MTSLETPELVAPGVTPYPREFRERYREAGHWRGKNLFRLLAERAALHPERIALVCGERRISYGQLRERAESLACALHERGLRAGDCILVQLPNCAEFVEICLAAFRLGVVPVMSHPAHRLRELTSLALQSRAVGYVIPDRHAGEDYLSLARALSSRVKTVCHVLVVGAAAEFTRLDSLLGQASARAVPTFPEPEASQLALLQLSGGSTGEPKLIPRTHDDYACGVLTGVEVCGFDTETVYLVTLPIGHNFPLSSPGVLGTLFAGGRVVFASSPEPRTVFPLIQRERVTVTSLVPPLLLLWLAAVRHRPDDLSSLRLLQVGGAKLLASLARQVAPALGCDLQQVFGMAEGLVCYTRDTDPLELVLESQGSPGSTADELRVVDAQDQDVPSGEVGQLLTRGPYTVRGYFAAKSHNEAAFTGDGFYRTGDLVRRLPSGHLVVEGRVKDQINKGGEKIASQEVEEALAEHPDVLDVAVVAMPDAALGERACAFVVPSREELTTAELRQFLIAAGLATYKVPDRFELVNELPTTSVGKVDKKQLRQQAGATRAAGGRAPSSQAASIKPEDAT